MRPLWRRVPVAAGTLAVAIGSAGAPGAEGFWPYSGIPLQQIARDHAVDLSPEWIRHLQRSTVRVNARSGGSGAFVSADGLVLTNRHVLPPLLLPLGAGAREVLDEGFRAARLTDELRLDGASLDALQSIEDVTARVLAAARQRLPGESSEQALARACSELGRRAGPAGSAEVVNLYAGAQFHLYRYRHYTDVRLVFSPEAGAAPHHDGAIDEFAYPASGLDAALLRVYVEGRPARIEHFLRWSRQGPQDGMPVFVSGVPTASQRHHTVAEWEFLRDVETPLAVEAYDKLAARLSTWEAAHRTDGTPPQDLQAARFWQRVMSTRLVRLQDPELLAPRRAQESQLLHILSQRGDQAALEAFTWLERSTIERARQYVRSQLLPWGTRQGILPWESNRPDALLPWGGDLSGPLFAYGVLLIRAGQERSQPEGRRARGFNAGELAELEAWLTAPRPVDPGVERVRWQAYLELAAQQLGANDPAVRHLLAGRSPAERAAQLVDGTRLGEASWRKNLLAASEREVSQTADPLLALLRDLMPEIERAGIEQEQTQARLAQAHQQVMRAVWETRGVQTYPDASRTLRLSYGSIRDDYVHSFHVPSITTLATLYDWHDHQYESVPFQLPRRWMEKRASVDSKAAINFISTADVTGGNSGSPTVNAAGELVGVLFGAETLLGLSVRDISFSIVPGERAAHVATPAILEALGTVYELPELVRELVEGHR